MKRNLKDHMKQAGEVIYCDIMAEPGDESRSKGCGLVEFETAEAAQAAIDTLTDMDLKGRNIFVREDREDMSIGFATHGGLRRGAARGRGRGRVGGSGGRGGAGVRVKTGSGNGVVIRTDGGGGGGGGKQIFVGNLPWTTTWQNLKDVFATVGTVERADVNETRDGA